MRVKVISEFREASDWSVLRRVGDIVDVGEARAAELCKLGLAEAAEPKPAEGRAEAAAVKAEAKRGRK